MYQKSSVGIENVQITSLKWIQVAILWFRILGFLDQLRDTCQEYIAVLLKLDRKVDL